MLDWMRCTSGEPHLVELVEGATEHRSLAAAGGHDALGELPLPVDDALPAKVDTLTLLALPVDFDRADFLEILD